jgi:uncharacterized protein YjfI (DUF2170 family)
VNSLRECKQSGGYNPPASKFSLIQGAPDVDKGQYWDAAGLAVALAGGAEVAAGQMSVSFRAEGVIEITLHDCGDLPVIVGVEGKEIQASVLLDPVDSVRDAPAFQNRLLRANKLLPLSTFGITEVSGKPHYEIFGQLSGGSQIEEIVEEVETLGRNALEAAEMIQSWNKG